MVFPLYSNYDYRQDKAPVNASLLFTTFSCHFRKYFQVRGGLTGASPARGSPIVLSALTLYLDFINLFLLLLRASSRNQADYLAMKTAVTRQFAPVTAVKPTLLPKTYSDIA